MIQFNKITAEIVLLELEELGGDSTKFPSLYAFAGYLNKEYSERSQRNWYDFIRETMSEGGLISFSKTRGKLAIKSTEKGRELLIEGKLVEESTKKANQNSFDYPAAKIVVCELKNLGGDSRSFSSFYSFLKYFRNKYPIKSSFAWKRFMERTMVKFGFLKIEVAGKKKYSKTPTKIILTEKGRILADSSHVGSEELLFKNENSSPKNKRSFPGGGIDMNFLGGIVENSFPFLEEIIKLYEQYLGAREKLLALERENGVLRGQLQESQELCASANCGKIKEIRQGFEERLSKIRKRMEALSLSPSLINLDTKTGLVLTDNEAEQIRRRGRE